MHAARLTFTAAPSYYAVYSTRPLDDIMPPAMLALQEIGLPNLRFAVADQDPTPQEIADFRAALMRERKRLNLFHEAVGGFNIFMGERLYSHLAIDISRPTCRRGAIPC